MTREARQSWAGSQRLRSMGTQDPRQMEQVINSVQGGGLTPGGLIFSFPQAECDLIEGLILQVERRKKTVRLNTQRCSLVPFCISNVKSEEEPELVSFWGLMFVLDAISQPRSLAVPGD